MVSQMKNFKIAVSLLAILATVIVVGAQQAPIGQAVTMTGNIPPILKFSVYESKSILMLGDLSASPSFTGSGLVNSNGDWVITLTDASYYGDGYMHSLSGKPLKEPFKVGYNGGAYVSISSTPIIVASDGPTGDIIPFTTSYRQLWTPTDYAGNYMISVLWEATAIF